MILSSNPYPMTLHFILIYFLAGQMAIPPSADTSLYFDIVVKDKIVGSLKATQNSKDSKTYYRSSTTIKTRIIKEIAVNYKYNVTFENEILKKADVTITVNKKPHAETHTLWKDTEYQITKNGKSEVALKETINYATISMYFEEPIEVNRCYSEQDGSFNTIIPLGNHSYKKVNAKGQENIYYYNEGVLEKTVIDGGLVQFEMIARE